MNNNQYYVIRAKGEMFYRSVYFVDSNRQYPAHYIDTVTGEITLDGDAYIKYTTSGLQDAEDTATHYTDIM